MVNLWEVNEEEDIEFSWGRKRCVGGPNNSVQFYDSFTYNGIEYFLYDCVYMWRDDQPEPHIGKLVKIWETASHKKKVKVVWFFRPTEVKHWLGDIEPSTNEIFLASGNGRGLFNLNPLEAICGKCNVACTSKDPRNPQPTEEDLRKADYIFYRTFDVQSCRISNNFANENAGVEVKHYFNLRNVQKSTLDTEHKESQGSIQGLDGQKNSGDWSSTGANQFALKLPAGNLVRLANSPKKDGSSGRYKKKFSDNTRAQKKRNLEVSLGPRPLYQVCECKERAVNSKDSFSKNINLAKAVIVNEKASKEACQYGQSRIVQSHSQTMERRRLNTDSSKWFKLQSWEDRMYEADEKGTLLLLENLDPSYTSTEVEEIVSRAFNQEVTAKMIKHTMFYSPNCGKAFVIFKSKDAADSVISCLRKRCLMLGDRRPVVGCRIKLGDPRNPSRFFGHFNILKVRMLKNHADKRNAVSASHYSQSNTVEYDMAMEWCGLDERSKFWWKALHEAQAKEMEDLRNQIEDQHDQDER